jgi:hypothetical protein
VRVEPPVRPGHNGPPGVRRPVATRTSLRHIGLIVPIGVHNRERDYVISVSCERECHREGPKGGEVAAKVVQTPVEGYCAGPGEETMAGGP